MFKIRALTPRDALKMAEVYGLCFSDVWETSFFEKKLQTTCVAYGAFEENSLVGFIFAQLIEGEGEILTFCVLPSYCRQGIGAALLENFLEQSRIETCFLEVNSKNQSARGLYERYEFEKKGIRAGYYAHFDQKSQDAIIYRYSKK